MKNILIASLVLCSASCFAHVTKGRGDTYMVDSHGASFKPKEQGRDEVKMMPQSEAMQINNFKSKSPLALY